MHSGVRLSKAARHEPCDLDFIHRALRLLRSPGGGKTARKNARRPVMVPKYLLDTKAQTQ